MNDEKLNVHSLLAAVEYMEKTGNMALPMKEKQVMINAIAHGFWMGVRWAQKGDSNVSRDTVTQALELFGADEHET